MKKTVLPMLAKMIAKIVMVVAFVVITQHQLFADEEASTNGVCAGPRVRDTMNNESNEDKTTEQDGSSGHETDTTEEEKDTQEQDELARQNSY